MDSSKKLKGIELPSAAAQFKIDSHKAVPDELTGKSTDSDEGAGTSPEVPNKLKDKSEARDDLEDWGSTDDEEYLLAYKDEKPKDIPWQSTDDDEPENDDEEEDAIEMNIVEEEDEENTKRVEEQKDDEELKADEEQKEDDQAGDEQVVKIPKQKINIIQQDVPHIEQEPFHAVKVSEVKSIVQRFTKFEQADHSTAILASIGSQVPSVVSHFNQIPKLKKELSEKKDCKDVNEEFVQANVINEVKNFLPKFLPLQLSLFLSDKPDKVLKKRDHGDDQDKDPLAGSNQGKNTKKRRFNESESSKKTSTTKESSKGKSRKSGKSVTAKESVEEPVFEIASDDVEQTFDDKVSNVGQPPHTDADETQADAAPRILKKDWFNEAPRPETLDPHWNTVKTVDDTPEQSWFNEMVYAKKPPLMFDELMSTPIDYSAFGMNCLKLNKITKVDLVGPVFNILKGTYKSCVELEYNMEECYRALTDQLDWEKPEGHKSLTDMSKPLPLQDKEVKEPYTPNYDPSGIICEDKSKKKRLMRVDEIHKFYDGTLQSVRKILHEMLLNFKFGYNKEMPLRE
ncbi:hypothetical protein Tco_1261028 [Tanacetum coccineum]